MFCTKNKQVRDGYPTPHHHCDNIMSGNQHVLTKQLQVK